MGTKELQMTYMDVDGATCSGCVYTIERLGRRIKGVDDVYVNRATNQIEMKYDGSEAAIEKMIEIVDKIGYTATPAEAAEGSDQSPLKPLG